MSKIEVDYSALYNANSEIKKIAEHANETFMKINSAHDILTLDNIMSHDYGKKLLSDIQSEQDKLARQKNLMEKYSTIMGRVADEYFEAETGSKSTAYSGGWKLPIISDMIAAIIGAGHTISSAWEDLFGKKNKHGGGGHSIEGKDTNSNTGESGTDLENDASSETTAVETDTMPGENNVPEPYDDSTVKRLMEEAEKYLGYPYVWGGSNPSTSFDCSGFISWVYNASGVHPMERMTAQGIYDSAVVISAEEAKPGDMIVFTGTYNSAGPVSHIGIYCGDGIMLHCGDPIQYENVNESDYWKEHFYAFIRWP